MHLDDIQTDQQLLVVGEILRPGSSGPAFSGNGSSARRLAGLLGAPVHEVVVTVNLVHSDRWSMSEARYTATGIRLIWDGPIIVCGRRGAKAFDIDDFLVWHGSIGAIPHPSGRCRYWNDPANVERARKFMRLATGR